MSKRKIIDQHLAATLKRLRGLKGVRLKSIVDAIGVSQQGISRWENGQIEFPHEKLPAYLKSIGSTQDELRRALAGSWDFSSAEVVPLHPPAADKPSSIEVYPVPDEAMSPWCEPGENIYVQRGRLPKRMEGCYVELASGISIIRRYIRERDGIVHLERLHPEEVEEYPVAEILGLHRIKSRGD